MIFSTTYKNQTVRTDADNFDDARDDIENEIGRPLPEGSIIKNEATGETLIIRWGVDDETTELPSDFIRRVNGTSSEQLDAFSGVLQCDLFGVNE